ncbi:hypothetical protein [Glaesserella parasuis]|nr:hypothetical protein [Glaesserella parasuis]
MLFLTGEERYLSLRAFTDKDKRTMFDGKMAFAHIAMVNSR